MKHLMVVSFLMLIASSAFAADCGKITSISIVGDHGDDWVAGATVQIDSGKVRITKTSSPNFCYYLLKEMNDKMGFFVPFGL